MANVAQEQSKNKTKVLKVKSSKKQVNLFDKNGRRFENGVRVRHVDDGLKGVVVSVTPKKVGVEYQFVDVDGDASATGFFNPKNLVIEPEVEPKKPGLAVVPTVFIPEQPSKKELRAADAKFEKAMKKGKKMLPKMTKKEQKLTNARRFAFPVGSDFEIIIGSAVAYKTDPQALVGHVAAIASDITKGEVVIIRLLEPARTLSTNEEIKEISVPKDQIQLWIAPKKTRFEDIGLFGAFVYKDRTFVKTSKSNAIAAVVRGDADEPFAMLATADAPMGGTSVRRFKKSDKVDLFKG